MFSNFNFHSTTIEIDSKQNLIDLKQFDHHFDLHKDIEFNQLDDIFNFCNPRNTIIVKLKKGLRGLGIALSGGKKFEINDQIEENKEQNVSLINQLIRVKKLYPAHPASECGLIEENDFILDVNEHCFVGLTYIEAFNILHSVQDEVNLKILKFQQCPLELKKLLQPKELNESLFENSINDSFREPNIFESTRIIDLNEEKTNTITQLVKNKITLIKKDNSLGFILSKIENEGFYIKQITKEPASLAKLSPGDKILNVNGVSLDGLDLSSAISFLRSLPEICELELEQTMTCDSLDNSLNYNDQSETEDDNRFKKRELRHEVKIMLDSRSKDSLHKRLKRKELKKIKDQDITKEQKIINESINKECLEQESCLEEEINRSNKENDKFNKENIDIFMKLNNSNNQFTNESSFFRQSSVIDFNKKEFGKKLSNENSKNNLNKWRNAVLNEDGDESDKKNMFKTNSLREDQDSIGDSGFINDSSMNNKINLINKNNLFNKVNQDLINLNDIQLKLNNNCLLNENSKLYRNIDALFFHVYLNRKMAGRLGFSLTDDISNDYRIVNTIKHGFSACVVKMVYPNSIAFNSNIKIGDKLLEVTDDSGTQQMINKPVDQVIKELRKIKGKIKLLFLRKIY